MTTRPDPVTEARDALVEAMDCYTAAWVRERLDNLIALARAEAGVSADDIAAALHKAEVDCWPTVDACQAATNHQGAAIRMQTALAARSAGSGSRVERGPCCEHAEGAHASEWGACLIDLCRCLRFRPTPPPAVDGTRWDKTKRCEAVVDGLPCHMPPESHPKVVRNRPEYDHQFLPCHPATPPTPAPVDGTRCGECPHAAHTGDICDTDRPGFVTGCPCRTATPPTPAPAVDGTRCAECGGVKDDVFHVPCLVGGPFHNVKTCHPFTPPAPAPDDRLRALEKVAEDWHYEWHLAVPLADCDHPRCKRAARALLADGERADG